LHPLPHVGAKEERERCQLVFAMVVRIASSPPCGCKRRERDQLGFAMVVRIASSPPCGC